MSSAEVENMAAKYRSAGAGAPLRYSLGAAMPEDRAAFLSELAVATEVDPMAEPLRQFKASYFTGGTDINDGLKIRGERAGGDLPPAGGYPPRSLESRAPTPPGCPCRFRCPSPT